MAADDRSVFVVDDDEAALDSLVLLLGADGLDALAYPSPRDLLDTLDPEARGCVVTDLHMPGMDGVQLIRALRTAGSGLPVIVITGQADVARAVDAMKAGAIDFIQKPYESELILRTVRAALAQDDAAAGAGAARAKAQRRMEALTARERQVLELIMEGASNKAIAARLAISPRTVEIYRANVMSKMRADSLSDLIRMTLAAGVA